MPITGPVLALLISATPAGAAMVGAPVSQPQAGRVSLGPSIDYEEFIVSEVDCDGSACQGIRRPTEAGGRVELAIIRGVGLHLQGGWISERIKEAGYDGKGFVGTAGLDLALRLGGDLHLAAVGQLQLGRSWTLDSSGVTDENRADWQRLRVSGLLAWAPGDHGFCAYAGPSYHPWFRHNATMWPFQLHITTRPWLPVGAVAGIEARSDVLGLPWGKAQSRMLAGAELRADSGLGISGWLGLLF